MSLNATKVIDARNVSFNYDKDTIFKNVNFCVYENEFLGVIGPNGGGKSLFMKLILNLLKPSSGNIEINKNLRNKIGYVPQNTNINIDFPILAIEVVEMGFLKKSILGFRANKALREKAMQMLDKLKISHIAYKKIGLLSGGERQKVLIARALVSNPELLLLDEPTSNVDISAQSDIYNILKSLCKNLTLVMVSHDIAMILQYATRILHINRNIVSHEVPNIAIDSHKHICEIDILENFMNIQHT